MDLNQFIRELKNLTDVKISKIVDENYYKATVEGIINDMPTEKKLKTNEMFEIILKKISNIEDRLAKVEQDVSDIKIRLTNVENDVCILKQEAVNQGWNI